MKLVFAVIKPFKLTEVKEALQDRGFAGLTISEAKGYGRQRGHTELYKGSEYQVDFIPKLRLELVVEDDDVDIVVDTIRGAAQTGTIGDGKIFVLNVEQALRVRTGETGDAAL
jgi:nitrogen regulatory protein PII